MGTPGPAHRLYDQRASELEELRQKLEASLRPEIHVALLDWVRPQADTFIEELVGVFGRRTEQFERINARVASGKAGKKELRRRYFEIINPAPIARELSDAADISALAKTYDAVLSNMQRQPGYGGLVGRFHLPANAVHAVLGQALAPLEDVYTAVEAHALNVRDHFNLLKKQKDGKWKKVGARVVAGVAGTALAGPFGGIAAREGMRWLLRSDGTEDESRDVMWEGYDKLQGTFFDAAEEIEQNLFLGLMTLYGGLLIRVQEDIELFGEELDWVSFPHSRLGCVLRPDARDEFVDWAERTLRYLRQHNQDGRWTAVANSGDAALAYALKTPARRAVTRDHSESSYALYFARQRAFALWALGDELWQGGDYVGAAKAYGRLLEGCALAAGRPAEQDVDPYDRVIAEAGWRIALVATSSFGAGEPGSPNADALPAFVAQALARFPYGDELCAVGEQIAWEANLIAKVIGAFLKDPGDAPRYRRRLPQRIKGDPEALDAWASRLDDFTIPSDTVKYLSTPPKPLEDARIYRALRSKRNKSLLAAAIVLLVILLMVGGLVWAGWSYLTDPADEQNTSTEPVATKEAPTEGQQSTLPPAPVEDTGSESTVSESVDTREPEQPELPSIDRLSMPPVRLAHAVLDDLCNGDADRSTTRDRNGRTYEVVSCETCPSFTSKPDMAPWKATSMLTGSFTKPGAEEVIVDMHGCESDYSSYYGGTLLAQRDADGWTKVQYRPALRLDDCARLERLDGTHLAVCDVHHAGHGESFGSTFVYDPRADQVTNLVRHQNNLEMGARDLIDQRLEDIRTRTLDGDDVPDLEVIYATQRGYLPDEYSDYITARDDGFSLASFDKRHLFTFDGRRLRPMRLADVLPAATLADSAVDAVLDFEPDSDAALYLHKRRLAAFRHAQMTKRFETETAEVASTFPDARLGLLRQLAAGCEEAADYACAKRAHEQLLETAADKPHVRSRAAWFYATAPAPHADVMKATNLLVQARKDDAADARVALTQAQILLEQDKPDKARSFLQEYQRENPDSFVDRWLAFRGGKLERVDAPRPVAPKLTHKLPAEWRDGVSSGPFSAREKVNSVDLRSVELRRAGEFDHAIAFHTASIERAAGKARERFVLSLGKTYEAARRYDDALLAYDVMLAEAPESPQIHNRLAWFLLTTSSSEHRDLERGRWLAEKAARLTSHSDPSVLDTLAEAHLRQEQDGRAIELLERCIELDPTRDYYRERLLKLRTAEKVE